MPSTRSLDQLIPSHNRRVFLRDSGVSLGSAALASILAGELRADEGDQGILPAPHDIAPAKRVIYLFMSGGPSQIETFDNKPALIERNGEELPDSVRKGQRLTGMSGNQSTLPLAGSAFRFARHGQCGHEISELLPHTAEVADELAVIKSVHTEAINHDPAITFFQTGSQIAGRPSMGAWLSYGLGTSNRNLPTFCVLVTKDKGGQPLYARLWGSGFLPARHQGVQFRSGRDPVLYLQNPDGVSQRSRRGMLDTIARLNQLQLEQSRDPLIAARISQYEMSWRMQTSVPEATNVSEEPEHIFRLYGDDAKKPGTFAANCLLARRLAERGVRFIQLYHQGWDQHGGLPGGIRTQCRETDQPAAALIKDLKQRGMLEDTLVVWGGEFGRTAYSQGKLTPGNYGRDHHPRCFSMWMAGGGVRPGASCGQTDEFSYNIAEDPVHVHDIQATILHLLGIDHKRLTFRYQGRDFRITDVHGNIVQSVLTQV